jgi:hypothetical protein
MLNHKTLYTAHPNKKTKYHPLPLFQNGADLPLFTRSPDLATLQGDQTLASNPRPRYTQLSLFSGVTQ